MLNSVKFVSFRFMPSFFINSASFSVQKLFARCRDIFFIFSSALQLSSDLLKQHTVFPLFSRLLLLLFSMVQLRHRFSPHTNFEFFFLLFQCADVYLKMSELCRNIVLSVPMWYSVFSFIFLRSFFFPSTKVCETEHFCFFLTSISYMQSQTLGIRYNIVSSVAAMAAAATV